MKRSRKKTTGIISTIVAAIGAIIFAAFGALGSLGTPVATPPPQTPSIGGWYEIHFTAPIYPDKKEDHRGGIDEKLAAFIARAQKSVDISIYQLDLPAVTNALLDAKKRGARVRVSTDASVYEDKKENPSFKELEKAGIQVVAGNPHAIMHNKFVVVDGVAVWSGSWNFTENDTYRYNNNGIALTSPELASNYTVTFEKMFTDKKFGAQRKAGGTTPRLTIGGVTVENYFSPEDDVQEKILARLQTAARTIDFMAFSFTDDAIGALIRERAKAGVTVRGVFENTASETQFSEYPPMKRAGLDVWQDGNPYLMHHKVFIIDGKTVILGSFNFSQNARTLNDENLLIIDDASLALAFQQEFARVYAQAKNPPKK